MNISEKLRAKLRAKMMRALRELGLSDSHSLSIARADQAALVISIIPKSRGKKLDPDGCLAITHKGRQCRVPPAPGSAYCLGHSAWAKEEE